jgi:hypothetical protein
LKAWTSAVALRAHYRIGEICRGLEKAVNQHAQPTGGLSKTEVLKSAAISESSADRAEQLTKIITAADVERLCEQAAASGKPAPEKLDQEEATDRVPFCGWLRVVAGVFYPNAWEERRHFIYKRG